MGLMAVRKTREDAPRILLDMPWKAIVTRVYGCLPWRRGRLAGVRKLEAAEETYCAASLGLSNRREWRNWQTRRLQVPVPARV